MRDILGSVVASSLAGWRGTSAFGVQRQPEQLLELYEFEGCPYCRLVREALTEMDLDVLIRPCPKRGERFRPTVVEQGGKAQFPYLVDPNTGTALYESGAIIRYLAETYGARRPRRGSQGLRAFGSQLASVPRLGRGMLARGSKQPAQPLELYSFESSPYSRPVRERLCELELPYVLRNMGKAQKADMGPPIVRKKFYPDAGIRGRNRQRMFEETGRLQVPYLIDPNTDARMYESKDIIRYLNKTYAQ